MVEEMSFRAGRKGTRQSQKLPRVLAPCDPLMGRERKEESWMGEKFSENKYRVYLRIDLLSSMRLKAMDRGVKR